MNYLFKTAEELRYIEGTEANSLIGCITYNKKTKEYMILADMIGYDNGYTYCVVAFTHGVKRAVLGDFRRGEVAARHNGVTAWYSAADAAKYQDKVQMLQEFIDNRDTRTVKRKEDKIIAQEENIVDNQEIEALRNELAEYKAKYAELEAESSADKTYIQMLETAVEKDRKKIYKVVLDGKLRNVFTYRTTMEMNRKKKASLYELV